MSDQSTSSKRFVGLQGYLLGAAAIITALTTLIVSVGQLREAWCSNVGLLCSSPASKTKVKFADIKPVLRSPDDGAKFDNYPRTLDLIWETISGATAYQVDTEIQINGPVPNSTQWVPLNTATASGNQTTIEFTGANWGRWRISAVNEVGEKTQESDWRTFQFIK